jgi:hypothetical protein
LIDTKLILQDGALLSLAGSIFLLVLLWLNPRIFIGHFPKEILEVIPPRSGKERRMSLLLGLLIGVPGISALLWRVATLGSHSMRELFAYVFGVLFFFNVVDLIILDWLIVCWLKPRWTIVPGTEHVVVPNPYLHHFKEFLLGTAGLFVVSLAVAALLSARLFLPER